MKIKFAFLGFLALACFAASANAAVLTLNPTADTYLRNSGATAENQSYGGASQLLAGQHATLNGLTALFRFDLSALSASDTINSVTLTLTSNASGSGTAVTLTVFDLAAANAGWVEGNQNGTVGTGEASAKFRVNQTTNWAGSTGARTAGTDYVNTSLASFTGNASTIGTGTLAFTSTGAFLTTVDAAAGGILNLWIGTPTLTATSDFFRISSKEASATATSLVIDYSPIPEPSTWALLAFGLTSAMVLRRRRQS